MKTLTIRLPDALVREIERESQMRRVSRSEVVRGWLHRSYRLSNATRRNLAGDLTGAVRGLPSDLSSNKKKYLPELIRTHYRTVKRHYKQAP